MKVDLDAAVRHHLRDLRHLAAALTRRIARAFDNHAGHCAVLSDGDLLGETVLRATKNWTRFAETHGDDLLEASRWWLRRIMVNRAIDMWRAEQRYDARTKSRQPD